MPVLAFDVFGTLVDPAGVSATLRPIVGERAAEFAAVWRDKQLEYSFRRAAMGRYRDFAVCTEQALEYTARRLRVALDERQQAALLACYRRLPAYPDAAGVLPALRRRGWPLYAFSNGRRDGVEAVLQHAGLLAQLDGVVSVDEVGSFKPDPTVYRHFLQRAGAAPAEAWLISGNPFDVIGALAAGMRAVWVRRDAAAVFDPWELQPTRTVAGLTELPEALC